MKRHEAEGEENDDEDARCLGQRFRISIMIPKNCRRSSSLAFSCAGMLRVIRLCASFLISSHLRPTDGRRLVLAVGNLLISLCKKFKNYKAAIDLPLQGLVGKNKTPSAASCRAGTAVFPTQLWRHRGAADMSGIQTESPYCQSIIQPS